MKVRMSLLVLFVIVVLGSTNHIVLADPELTTIGIPANKSIPGCDETDTCYIPSYITIEIGNEVTWVNGDTVAHTVTSGLPTDRNIGEKFDSGLFLENDTFLYKFESIGTFNYFCLVHPWMIGAVTVTEKGKLDFNQEESMFGNTLDEIEDTLDSISETIEDSAFLPDKSEMIQMSGTNMDGTIMVNVYSSEPMESEPLSILVEFYDVDTNQLLKGVIHDTLVIQNHEEVNSFNEIFAEDGTSSHFTRPLTYDTPVDINVKILSIGVNQVQMHTGGEVVSFHVIPEFGAITAMILVIAIVSVIVATSKTNKRTWCLS